MNKSIRTLVFVSLTFWGSTIMQTDQAHAKPKHHETTIEQIEFRHITVGDALRILSEQSTLNIIASKSASEIQVTMFLRQVTPMQVIDAIAKTYNLWYQQDEVSKIVRLYTVKEYRLEQVEYRPEKMEIFTLKNAKNALDMADTIQNLFGERVSLSFGENQEEIINDLSDRFERFDFIDRQKSLSSSRSGRGNNRSSGSNFGSNNNRNSRRNRDNNFNSRSNSSFRNRSNNKDQDTVLESAREVLKDFQPGQQGNSLNNLLLGDLSESYELMGTLIRHQAPIYVGVIKRQNRVLVRTRDPDAMTEIKNLAHKLDNNSSMILMEVKILSIDLSDGYDSLFDFKVNSGDVAVSSLDSTTTHGLSNVIGAASGLFNPALLATVVSDNFEARLQLLERENRVTDLATPMLVTTNQEVSRVFVGQERPIVLGYESSSTSGDTGIIGSDLRVQPILVPETEVRPIGTTLLLTPNINADRTVSIRVLVEQSAIADEQASIPIPLNNVLVEASIDVVRERTFSGTVVAMDGTSVAIGGLIEESATNLEEKVPVLGDIPGLGFFFKTEGKATLRRELVVIIKPYIMGTAAEAPFISDSFLNRNSIHPQSNFENNTMDIYRNDRHQHKGYELQEPYKMYPNQDQFDSYHDKGGNRDYSSQRNSKQSPDLVSKGARNTYMELTRYAAKSVRIPKDERELVPSIRTLSTPLNNPINLSPDPRLTLRPVASWAKGGINVTALEVFNKSNNELFFDHKNIRGRWLASTIENGNLAGKGYPGDSTYLYLISSEPYDDVTASIQNQ